MAFPRSITKGVLFVILIAGQLTFPAPAISQTVPSIPGMEATTQVELSEDSAKNAIDGYIALKEEYGNDGVPAIDPNSPRELCKACSNTRGGTML